MMKVIELYSGLIIAEGKVRIKVGNTDLVFSQITDFFLQGQSAIVNPAQGGR
jgi:hypothetical protein